MIAQEIDKLEAQSKERYRGPYADANEKWHNDLEIELEWSERTGTPLTVLLIDLDNLKSVNDILGHEAGNRALKGIIDLLEELETGGVRIGGDEFGISLLADIHEATELAQELRTGYQQFLDEPENSDLTEAGAGLAVGIGVHRPDEGTRELLTEADRNMYYEKENNADISEEEKEYVRRFIEGAIAKGIKRRNVVRLVLAELRRGIRIEDLITDTAKTENSSD